MVSLLPNILQGFFFFYIGDLCNQKLGLLTMKSEKDKEEEQDQSNELAAQTTSPVPDEEEATGLLANDK